ncbi:hypothetical protein M3D15_04750 [Pseudoclavibacter alba]|uniref:Uncharacterized protein n=1 Tax=Pseudoclavibacter albus TaxID=272241 RepID=A0ABT2HWE9_9MICO|nr:hypothetical protein [Pseudoclavibacter alba]MCT2042644.1 hypothetical protein [Pseudoclavibacter alba]
MSDIEPTHRVGARLSVSISPNEAIFPRDQAQFVMTAWLHQNVESPIDGDRIARWRHHQN